MPASLRSCSVIVGKYLLGGLLSAQPWVSTHVLNRWAVASGRAHASMVASSVVIPAGHSGSLQNVVTTAWQDFEYGMSNISIGRRSFCSFCGATGAVKIIAQIHAFTNSSLSMRSASKSLSGVCRFVDQQFRDFQCV